jgi:hypothetical protein
MDGGSEQRVAIKFCFKAGLSATETLILVQKAYIAVVADLVKNDRRSASRMIAESLNIPQECITSDSERGFEKEKVVCTFCSTLLDT